MQQDVNGTATKYLWDEVSMFGDVVLEYDVNNAPLFSYTLAGNRLLSQTQNGDTHFYLHDGQGSVRGLTNNLGSITDTYDYTAFGELYASSEITPNHYRYTGQQFDDLTGLYSLRARYYAPDLGRFLSRDVYPLNQQDPSEWNRYVYVANNATNLIDPTGYMALGELALILSSIDPVVIGATILLGYLLVKQFQLIADALAIDIATLARKDDLRQVDRVAEEYGMTPEQRKKFGKYVENVKKKHYGRDLTLDELRDEAEDFLEDFG